MKFMNPLFICFLLIFSFCARYRQPKSESNVPDYRIIAREKLRDDFSIIFNEDQSYVICLKNPKKTSAAPIAIPPLHFIVFHPETETLIFEDNLPNGNVRWIDNDTIEVRSRSGVHSKDTEINRAMRGYTYDVKTRTKTQGIGDSRQKL